MKNQYFVYKLSANSELIDGSLYCIPPFCKRNCNSILCKKFYKDIIKNSGGNTCPDGFGAEYILVDGRPIIFTGLNVESKTNKKDVLKRLPKNAFYPRLPIEIYEKLKAECIQNIQENESTSIIEREEDAIKQQKEIIGNTIHDIRKLSVQLQDTSAKIIEELNSINSSYNLNELCTNLYALTNLLSIHLDTFDLEANPDLNLNLSNDKTKIPIYKKVEKVYKCLRSKADTKGIRINLLGQSYGLFTANTIIEIGIFILVDNAIKYSFPQSNIEISFDENGNQLVVAFVNWGIKPLDGELKHIFERGYRGKIYETFDIEGRGIGLYLFSEICEANEIKYKVSIVPNTTHAYNGWVYVPYKFELTFNNIIQPEQQARREHLN